MDTIFIFFQRIVPQHLLSRCTGWLARLQRPRWLKDWAIRTFIAHYRVNMEEAAEPDPRSYAHFNAFFTRALRSGARPLEQADILCPADGTISQLGAVVQDRIFQAKGRTYDTWELLGGDAVRAATFRDGQFVTIYLAPRDYHRVHMPVAGRLRATRYVPGDLFSVNTLTANRVDRLFARNERLVCHFDTAAGPMAMILVGAMVVAGIETVWSGQVAPRPRQPVHVDYAMLPQSVELAQGEEMGRFKLGSTVIVLFGRDTVKWRESYIEGTPTRLGAALGSFL